MNHIKPQKKINLEWNSNFIDIYRENLTNLKNDIEDSIHRAEIKGSPLEEDINEIAIVISEALGYGKIYSKNECKKETKTIATQTMVWWLLWEIQKKYDKI